MLTEICDYLHNYFDIDEYHAKLPKLEGTYTISDGKLPALDELLIKGQCFLIYGSYLNDGVYIYTDKLTLKDEVMKNVIIQSMHVPPEVMAISEEIQAWKDKYSGVDSVAMSPYQSESFNGYSYSKSGGGSAEGGGSISAAADPISFFAPRLRRWKKI